MSEEYKTFKELYGNQTGIETLKKLHPYNKMSSEDMLKNILKVVNKDYFVNPNEPPKEQAKASVERNINHADIDEALRLYDEYKKCNRKYREQLETDRDNKYKYPDLPAMWNPLLSELYWKDTREAAFAYFEARDKINKDDLTYLINDLKKKKAPLEQEYSSKLQEAEQRVNKYRFPDSPERRYEKNTNKFMKLKNVFCSLFWLLLLCTIILFFMDTKFWILVLTALLNATFLVFWIIFHKKVKYWKKRYQRVHDKRTAELKKAESILYLIEKPSEINRIDKKLEHYNLLLNRERII